MTTKKRVTMADVSRVAGVSPGTVSMILGNRPGVSFSAETVRAVRRAAENLGYTSQRRRTAPASTRKTVLVVSHNVSNGYYTAVIQAVQQAAAARGFATLIFTTYRETAREEDALNLACDIGAAGIIFTMMPISVARLEEVNQTLPVVVIGDRNASLSVDTVELDNQSAGRLLGRHLLDLGHRRIAFISTTLDRVNAIRIHRLEGIQAAFGGTPGASVEVFSRCITPEQELMEINIEHGTGYGLTLECLEKKCPVTAFAAVNDAVAFGVLDALAEKGRRVPEDFSVCGFDDLPFSRSARTALTTVGHHIVEKGRNAFDMLYRRIMGCTQMHNITRVEFPPHLVLGETTGPCRR